MVGSKDNQAVLSLWSCDHLEELMFPSALKFKSAWVELIFFMLAALLRIGVTRASNRTKTRSCPLEVRTLANSKGIIVTQWDRWCFGGLSVQVAKAAHMRSSSPRLPEEGCPKLGRLVLLPLCRKCCRLGQSLSRAGPARFVWGLEVGGSFCQAKKQGKGNPEDSKEQYRVFLIFNFQLTMENVKVCEIEWWGGSVQKGVLPVAGPDKRGLDGQDIKPQINIYPAERALSSLLFTASGYLAGWARLGEIRLLGASLGHLVAGSLIILLQRVKILRALPNPKGTQAHWEFRSLAMHMWSSLRFEKHSKQSYGPQWKVPTRHLDLWS